jgi:adenosyl cobinamide kinase/adenosyl cobinamide phosphate guanylyltransferase
MIIVPPSVHPTGVPYRWMTLPGGPPKGVNFAPLPDAFRNAVLLSGGGEGALIGSDINATGINPRDGGVTQRDKRDIVLTEGNRDESLYHLAACLKRGGMGLADAKQILEIAAKSCNPPFPLQQALAKADAVYSEEGLPADRNLSQLIRDWVRDNPGTWNVTSLDNDMSRMSRSEKTNRRKVLSRLVAEGVIERVPGQPRLYRTVNTELQTIDWVNADVSNVYPIRFPFQLESLCTIYPKNIIVIAGSYNGGKSAFCYNIVRKNMNHLPVRLISSEVSPEELKLRLSQFSEVSLHEWQQAEFLERSRDFAQVVRPDALNIIDYLEVGGDEFSRVGDRIKEIWEKLTTGVCVISLQKKKDVGDVQYDHGRGGELSAEKARLYLKIDNNVLKIVKAKNWANSLVNPNGRHFGFKLVGGCNFIEQFDEE